MSTTTHATPSRALAKVARGSFVRVADLPGTLAAKSSAVCRAHKAGDLVAVRKGLYFKGFKTRYGMTAPTSEEVATEVLGTTGVGPTGYSAARALGLTTQVPSELALTIAGPTPTSLPGVKISRRNNMCRRNLRYTEIALLELLRGGWETTVDGGWPALLTAYRTATAAGDIRPHALRTAIAHERSPRARRNFDLLTVDTQPH